LNDNTILKSIDIHAMTLSFNCLALDAMNDCLGAKQATMAVPQMTKFGIVFVANDLFPTAPAHVKEHLEKVIKGKVTLAKLPSKYKDTTLPVTTAPPAKSSVDGGTATLPTHVVTDPRSLVAPKNLIRVRPDAINHDHGQGSTKRRRTNLVSAPAATPTTAMHSFSECPHCPNVFRGSKTHAESCPFSLWKNEPGASRPSRAFHESLGRQLTENEAWRIAYSSMTKSPRLAICQRYGCTKAHEEWE